VRDRDSSLGSHVLSQFAVVPRPSLLPPSTPPVPLFRASPRPGSTDWSRTRARHRSAVFPLPPSRHLHLPVETTSPTNIFAQGRKRARGRARARAESPSRVKRPVHLDALGAFVRGPIRPRLVDGHSGAVNWTVMAGITQKLYVETFPLCEEKLRKSLRPSGLGPCLSATKTRVTNICGLDYRMDICPSLSASVIALSLVNILLGRSFSFCSRRTRVIGGGSRSVSPHARHTREPSCHDDSRRSLSGRGPLRRRLPAE